MTFADEKPPGRNLTDEDKERFKRLQKMERRYVEKKFRKKYALRHLSPWEGGGESHIKRTGVVVVPVQGLMTFIFFLSVLFLFCRVFFQHLSRWTANSHLNLSD